MTDRLVALCNDINAHRLTRVFSFSRLAVNALGSLDLKVIKACLAVFCILLILMFIPHRPTQELNETLMLLRTVLAHDEDNFFELTNIRVADFRRSEGFN